MDEKVLVNSSNADLDLESKPWWALVVPLVVGPIALVLGTWWSSGSSPLAFTVVMIALAAVATGGFLGFLFGIPRSTIGNGDIGNSREPLNIAYTPSTNLEQVADWLTKIIIGVGLVEIRSIGETLSTLGILVQNSVAPDFGAANVITQASVVSFFVLTFLAAYLWTRIHYGPLQMRTDKDVISDIAKKLNKIASETQDQKTDIEKALKIPGMIVRGELAAPSVPSVQNKALEVVVEAAMTSWPVDVRTKFEEFENAPRTWDSDPGQTVFQVSEHEKDGLVLQSEVSEELPDVLVIKLKVHPLPNEMLSGMVTFLLHPTLAVPVRHVPVVDDSAEVQFASQGWFTAVAIANEGKTILGLDLRTIPGVPRWFVEN